MRAPCHKTRDRYSQNNERCIILVTLELQILLEAKQGGVRYVNPEFRVNPKFHTERQQVGRTGQGMPTSKEYKAPVRALSLSSLEVFVRQLQQHPSASRCFLGRKGVSRRHRG